MLRNIPFLLCGLGTNQYHSKTQPILQKKFQFPIIIFILYFFFIFIIIFPARFIKGLLIKNTNKLDYEIFCK